MWGPVVISFSAWSTFINRTIVLGVSSTNLPIPNAPWCWNIYQHLPSKSPSYVCKYTSTMEHMGILLQPSYLYYLRVPHWLTRHRDVPQYPISLIRRGSRSLPPAVAPLGNTPVVNISISRRLNPGPSFLLLKLMLCDMIGSLFWGLSCEKPFSTLVKYKNVFVGKIILGAIWTPQYCIFSKPICMLIAAGIAYFCS